MILNPPILGSKTLEEAERLEVRTEVTAGGEVWAAGSLKGFLHSLTASYEDVKMQKSMPNVTQIPKLNRQGLSKGST